MQMSKATSERKDIVFSRAIPATLRAEALASDGFTCHMCGIGPGEIDSATGRKARLRIGHLIGKNLGGKDKTSNLWAACSICTDGMKYITSERPNALWLMSQIQRSGQDEQRAVLRWLREKFKD